MNGFRLTPRALRDLESIADYTLDQWGPDQMAHYLRKLNGRLKWLARNPLLGRARDDVGKDYRCFPEGEHLVFYIVERDHITIIGLPHRAMDISDLFV